MRRSSKKGYVLAMAMYFAIIAALTSVGIYSYAYHISKEIAVDEAHHIKGYYAAMGALRYASILLRDPVTNFGFQPGTPDGVCETATRSVCRYYPALAMDLGLRDVPPDNYPVGVWTGPHDVTIVVSERATDGLYDVSANYRHTPAPEGPGMDF